MKFTREEFDEKIEEIKKLLEFYNNDELFEGETKDNSKKIANELEGLNSVFNLSLFRYYCNVIGGDYSGYLFGSEGIGTISNFRDLKYALELPKEENLRIKVWVVPVDVHY